MAKEGWRDGPDVRFVVLKTILDNPPPQILADTDMVGSLLSVSVFPAFTVIHSRGRGAYANEPLPPVSRTKTIGRVCQGNRARTIEAAALRPR